MDICHCAVSEGSPHIAPRVRHMRCSHTHRTCRSSRTPLLSRTLSLQSSSFRTLSPSLTCRPPRPPRVTRARRVVPVDRRVWPCTRYSRRPSRVLSGPSAPLRPPAPRVVRRIGRCAVARVRSPPPPSCLPPPPHRIARVRRRPPRRVYRVVDPLYLPDEVRFVSSSCAAVSYRAR